jgi:hypothetical protein
MLKIMLAAAVVLLLAEPVSAAWYCNPNGRHCTREPRRGYIVRPAPPVVVPPVVVAPPPVVVIPHDRRRDGWKLRF